MVNTVPAKYPVQIGPAVTHDTDAELAAWGELLEISKGVAARECIEDGLKRKRIAYRRELAGARGISLDEVTELFEATKARKLAESVARAERQKGTRADYAERTAKGETAMSTWERPKRSRKSSSTAPAL